jgi:hypothetical protein
MTTVLKKNQSRSLQIVNNGPQTTFVAPNTWKYQLTNGFSSQEGDMVSLKYMSIYYSWKNVSAALGNNTFGYYWNVSGVQTLFTLILQDGIYAYQDISAAFNLFMFGNGHYLLDANGNPIYYISLTVNPALYSLSLICAQAPSPLPTGYTNPNSITLGGNGPQLVIPAGFTSLSGFAVGTFPAAPQTALYQVNSISPPQITQQPTINVNCNLANNVDFTNGSSTIYSFNATNKVAGSLIELTPTFRDWLLIAPGGNYTAITISLTDQLGSPITIYDTTGFVITLNLCNGSPN